MHGYDRPTAGIWFAQGLLGRPISFHHSVFCPVMCSMQGSALQGWGTVAILIFALSLSVMNMRRQTTAFVLDDGPQSGHTELRAKDVPSGHVDNAGLGSKAVSQEWADWYKEDVRRRLDDEWYAEHGMAYQPPWQSREIPDLGNEHIPPLQIDNGLVVAIFVMTWAAAALWSGWM